MNTKSYEVLLSISVLTLVLTVPGWSQVTTVEALVEAVNNGSVGDEVRVAAGTFRLSEPLQPKSGMTLRGAGRGKTIIQGAASWIPGTDNLPDGETDHQSVDRNAYLVDLGDNTENVTLTDLTLTGPNLHGAVYGNNCDGLELYNLEFNDFLWCSVRTFRMTGARVHDNLFVDAGGQYRVTGGALFMTWTTDSEFWNNTIKKSEGLERNFYGFKGRQARNCRFHHNTVLVNFSIELPFENDSFVEIDHNYLLGTVSIPKFAGGVSPDSGYTFHVHHNYFTSSYALEWARNGVEVDHNLFDFNTEQDKGNLISNFGSQAADGPTRFHNNLIKNPGRGLIWSRGVYNNYHFYNNHVIANRTITPREDGLFGFNPANDFTTITIRDNIIECVGISRPLMRNSESYEATIVNNTLVNVSDADSVANPVTEDPRGPLAPLSFTCGANEAYRVNQWTISETTTPAPSSVVIYAAGRTNEEAMELRVDGQTVARWANVAGSADGRDFVAYRYEADGTVTASQVQVAFTNDDGRNRDLRVDRLEIDGAVYQTEAVTTYSTGTWQSGTGCSADYKQSEWLQCNGYFAYDQPVARSNDSDVSFSEVRLFPNPASQTVRIYLPNRQDEVIITLSDGVGRPVLQHRQPGTHPVVVPVQTLLKGLYQVSVQQSGQETTHKLLIE